MNKYDNIAFQGGIILLSKCSSAPCLKAKHRACCAVIARIADPTVIVSRINVRMMLARAMLCIRAFQMILCADPDRIASSFNANMHMYRTLPAVIPLVLESYLETPSASPATTTSSTTTTTTSSASTASTAPSAPVSTTTNLLPRLVLGLRRIVDEKCVER
jgi:hypothetical protein